MHYGFRYYYRQARRHGHKSPLKSALSGIRLTTAYLCMTSETAYSKDYNRKNPGICTEHDKVVAVLSFTAWCVIFMTISVFVPKIISGTAEPADIPHLIPSVIAGMYLMLIETANRKKE